MLQKKLIFWNSSKYLHHDFKRVSADDFLLKASKLLTHASIIYPTWKAKHKHMILHSVLLTNVSKTFHFLTYWYLCKYNTYENKILWTRKNMNLIAELIFYVIFSCHRFFIVSKLIDRHIFAVANKNEGRIFIFFISVLCIGKAIDGSTRKIN